MNYLNWIIDYWFIKDVLRPLIDIAIITFILYQVYKILVQTKTVHLVKGMLSMFLLFLFALMFQIDTVLWVMRNLTQVIMMAIVVVFQPELRKIFNKIGISGLFNLRARVSSNNVESAVSAAHILADRRRGALIVFSRSMNLKGIIETGTTINADVTASLIISLFEYDTPLHDGAIVIGGNKIIAAGCFLPLSKQDDIKQSFGTRHRAALGLSEESDSIVLIASEETGALSIAYDSNIYYNLPVDEVTSIINKIQSSGSIDVDGGLV
ncbi:MAG: diadenylate cyclase CdaA [Spirochaetaceae bacterium]